MAFTSQVSEFLPEGNLETLTRLGTCDWFPYQPCPYNLETVLMETSTYKTHWMFLTGREKIQRPLSKWNVPVRLCHSCRLICFMMIGFHNELWHETLVFSDLCCEDPDWVEWCLHYWPGQQNFPSVSYMHVTSITWPLLIMQQLWLTRNYLT